jgi:hypothetical protein
VSETLTLKWGTLKAWNLEGEASRAAVRKYFADGVSMGAAQQRDTAKQKQALCELIDAVDGPITNDWSGEQMTKDEAKKYVLEYRS